MPKTLYSGDFKSLNPQMDTDEHGLKKMDLSFLIRVNLCPSVDKFFVSEMP